MKITKDIRSVWNLENGDTIIGCSYIWKTGEAYAFFVKSTENLPTAYNHMLKTLITEYTKEEMVKIYSLTADDFANINGNHF